MIETLRFNFIENIFDGGIGELFSPSYPKSLAVHDLIRWRGSNNPYSPSVNYICKL